MSWASHPAPRGKTEPESEGKGVTAHGAWVGSQETCIKTGTLGPRPLATWFWYFAVNPALGRTHPRIYIKSHMEKSEGGKEAVGKVVKTSFKRKVGQIEKFLPNLLLLQITSKKDYPFEMSHLPEGTALHIHTFSETTVWANKLKTNYIYMYIKTILYTYITYDPAQFAS